MLICSKCNQELPPTEFYTYKSGKYFFQCKACYSKLPSQSKRHKQGHVKILNTMFNSAKSKALEKNWDFNLTKDFLLELNSIQNGLCAISGIPLNWEPKEGPINGKYPIDRASLDRIDSSKGYTKDNVQLVTAFINVAKQYHSTQEVIDICRIVSKYNLNASAEIESAF